MLRSIIPLEQEDFPCVSTLGIELIHTYRVNHGEMSEKIYPYTIYSTINNPKERRYTL